MTTARASAGALAPYVGGGGAWVGGLCDVVAGLFGGLWFWDLRRRSRSVGGDDCKLEVGPALFYLL